MSATVKNRDKADYLLDKGLNILWSKGYNGTSVNDIVSAADVPKGSFYFYFKSKEDFTVHALQRYFSLKRAATIEVLSHENIPAVERLFNYYNHRVTIVRDQLNCSLGCMGCNIGLEMAEHSESIRTTIVHEEQKTREIIELSVDTGKSNYFEIRGKGTVSTEWFEAEKTSSGTYELTAKGRRDMEKAVQDAAGDGSGSGGSESSGGGCGG